MMTYLARLFRGFRSIIRMRYENDSVDEIDDYPEFIECVEDDDDDWDL